jgi:hypothetical protein
MMRHLFAPLAAALAVAGCASVDTHATFVTKTSVALLDVDSAPSGVSFGYQRTEGYLGPRLQDGSAVPVVGFIRTNGSLLGRSLQQVYATGCAAEMATRPAQAASASPASAPAAGSACAATPLQNAQVRPMLFATGTTLGVGFSLGEGNAPSLTLGYRRKEASIIPVDPGAMPSVLAAHGNVVEARATEGRPAGELGISQYFATGRAADALASRGDVVNLFTASTQTALGAYREQERLQSQHVLTTLGCLSGLKDERLPAVWRHADALGLLPAGTHAAALESAGVAKAREVYTKSLAILNADSADTTTLMSLHRRFVCDLSKQP